MRLDETKEFQHGLRFLMFSDTKLLGGGQCSGRRRAIPVSSTAWTFGKLELEAPGIVGRPHSARRATIGSFARRTGIRSATVAQPMRTATVPPSAIGSNGGIPSSRPRRHRTTRMMHERAAE